MNPSGLVLAVAGVWVLSQVLAGQALQRLGLFGTGAPPPTSPLNPASPNSPANPTNPQSPLNPLNPASPLNPFHGINLTPAPAPPVPAAPTDVISA